MRRKREQGSSRVGKSKETGRQATEGCVPIYFHSPLQMNKIKRTSQLAYFCYGYYPSNCFKQVTPFEPQGVTKTIPGHGVVGLCQGPA